MIQRMHLWGSGYESSVEECLSRTKVSLGEPVNRTIRLLGLDVLWMNLTKPNCGQVHQKVDHTRGEERVGSYNKQQRMTTSITTEATTTRRRRLTHPKSKPRKEDAKDCKAMPAKSEVHIVRVQVCLYCSVQCVW